MNEGRKWGCILDILISQAIYLFKLPSGRASLCVFISSSAQKTTEIKLLNDPSRLTAD